MSLGMILLILLVLALVGVIRLGVIAAAGVTARAAASDWFC